MRVVGGEAVEVREDWVCGSEGGGGGASQE